ncbi:MAG: hypothetical protein K6E99_04110 [Bacilli bacterium]|nr:hypothetical protein [Bacilli bacterium]
MAEKKKTAKKNVKNTIKAKQETKVEAVKKESKLKKIGGKIKAFFNDPRPIIIVLIILVCLLNIGFANYKSNYRVYQGFYASDEINIRSIHAYIHPKVSTFYSSGAVYTGEEKKVYQYRIGYYYESGDSYNFLKESTEDLDTPIDLADIISKTSYFDYSESQIAENLVFTRDARKNIGKLHFMVFASTTKETTDEYDIAIDCPIDFTEF